MCRLLCREAAAGQTAWGTEEHDVMVRCHEQWERAIRQPLDGLVVWS